MINWLYDHVEERSDTLEREICSASPTNHVSLPSLQSLMRKPAPYEEMKIPFWDDDHISKQMLSAHLNPDSDGASRRLDFIDRSVAWIQEQIPPKGYPTLLDIGCGPGIYAERFAKCGYRVTGVDFSRRSIRYARENALKNDLEITYLFQNYLQLDIDQQFDLCTMIYCDYGVLSKENRRKLLQHVYRHLKPNGIFIFDAFSLNYYKKYEEKNTWEYCSNGGFWSEKEYLVLNRFSRYPDHIILDHYTVMTEGKTAPYYIWNTCFSPQELKQEVEEIGFITCGVFGDVAGSSCSETSDTIALILKKLE